MGYYLDIGISGTTAQRPEFQRLIKDCRDGKIDYIITKSFSRFARNTVVLLETVRELKNLGIDVCFEKDHINSLSAQGELLITLLAAYAQAESESASENQRWRIQKMFEQGIPNTGRMLGYRLKGDHLEIVPVEARIVRRIFHSYLNGLGLNAIARKLNEDGITTINGTIWRDMSVRSILSNEKYTGNLLLQKTYRKNYLDKKRIVNRGERNQYYVENSHEAIISQDDFDSAKARLYAQRERYKQKFTRDNKGYAFTSRITCGHCGKHYRRKINAAGTKYAKAVWICPTYVSRGKSVCPSQQIPEKILEQKTKELLCWDDLYRLDYFIKEIRVSAPGVLFYLLQDGQEITVTWQNASRKESWTKEMREVARKRVKQA